MTERSRPTAWRTLQTPDGLRPGPREQQREARAYAERWYQAVREPVIDEVPLTPTERGTPTGGRMVVVGVGAFSSRPGPALGGGSRTICYVRTPGPRRFTEGELGREISTMQGSASPDLAELGELLERTLCGNSLASLEDERGGWASPRDRAVRYGVAVLTLAVRLGDERAEANLRLLQKSNDSLSV